MLHLHENKWSTTKAKIFFVFSWCTLIINDNNNKRVFPSTTQHNPVIKGIPLLEMCDKKPMYWIL